LDKTQQYRGNCLEPANRMSCDGMLMIIITTGQKVEETRGDY
jgi:hypothetical protein